MFGRQFRVKGEKMITEQRVSSVVGVVGVFMIVTGIALILFGFIDRGTIIGKSLDSSDFSAYDERLESLELQMQTLKESGLNADGNQQTRISESPLPDSFGYVGMVFGLVLIQCGLIRSKNSLGSLLGSFIAVGICGFSVSLASLDSAYIWQLALSLVIGLAVASERFKFWASLAIVILFVGTAILVYVGLVHFVSSPDPVVTIHLYGGIGVLIGFVFTILIGPRAGKFGRDGTIYPIPGSNLPLASIGLVVYVLSQLVLYDNQQWISSTMLSWGGGVISSAIISRLLFSKADFTMILNGGLSGAFLVFGLSPDSSGVMIAVASLVCGALVTLFVVLLDKLKIDDPPGFLSTFGVPILVAALVTVFQPDMMTKSAIAFDFAFFIVAVAAIGMVMLKVVIGIRVSEEEEYEGTDANEVGMGGYPEFGNLRND
ncbi:MAG: hypothetical protein AAGI44_05840 [Pseudomonadota bacterium]